MRRKSNYVNWGILFYDVAGSGHVRIWKQEVGKGQAARRRGSISESCRASAQVLFKAISPSKRGQVIH